MTNREPQINDLRVWWIPQVPGNAFYVPVRNCIEAKLVLNTLASYDQFQFDENVKPDYTNAGGLQRYVDEGDGPEWLDWHPHPDDDDGDILDPSDMDDRRLLLRYAHEGEITSHTPLQAVMEHLAGNLPEHYYMDLIAERGSGSVTLYDDCGDPIPLEHEDPTDFGGLVQHALETATQHHVG